MELMAGTSAVTAGPSGQRWISTLLFPALIRFRLVWRLPEGDTGENQASKSASGSDPAVFSIDFISGSHSILGFSSARLACGTPVSATLQPIAPLFTAETKPCAGVCAVHRPDNTTANSLW